MRDFQTILNLYLERRSGAAKQLGHWREVASVYDSGVATPLPDYDEVVAAAVPGLIMQGIDSYARRFAEVSPAVSSPPVRPNIASSRKRASERSKVIRGWWEHSYLPLANYQRGRYYFGYGAMPAIVRSHAEQAGVPVSEALNPMCVLPGPKHLDYSPEIPDGFVAYQRSASWVARTYGVELSSSVGHDYMVEVVEYEDDEQCVMFCLGPATGGSAVYRANGVYPRVMPFGTWAFENTKPRTVVKGSYRGWAAVLYAQPNYAERCRISYPGAISMSKVAGLVDSILGMHRLQAQTMALTVKAIDKGIWPDQWAVFGENGGGRIIKQANGRKGIVGEIEGGSIEAIQIQPGYQTWNLLDRLEAAQRSTAGIVPQMGGYNPTNVRTGRASDTVAGFAVDPVLREAHTIIETALEHENRLMVAVAKGYGGSRPRSFYVSAPGAMKERVDYAADDLFGESDETKVQYSIAGADMQMLIVAAGQSIGTEMMSKHRARQLNPLVEDPEAEAIAILAETTQAMILGSLQEMLATASPEDAAFILRKIKEGEALEDVLAQAQRRAQERQASAGPLGAPDGPVPEGSPEAQPGLAPPGAGAEAPVAVPEVEPSMANLAQLFGVGQRARAAAGAA